MGISAAAQREAVTKPAAVRAYHRVMEVMLPWVSRSEWKVRGPHLPVKNAAARCRSANRTAIREPQSGRNGCRGQPRKPWRNSQPLGTPWPGSFQGDTILSRKALFSASGVPVGDKMRAFDEDRGGGPERRQRLLGLGDQRLEPRLGRSDPEDAHHG